MYGTYRQRIETWDIREGGGVVIVMEKYFTKAGRMVQDILQDKKPPLQEIYAT